MELLVVTARTTPPARRRGDAAVRRDRAEAERCLARAQRLAGATAERRRDPDGAPRPAAGWHWSWTHTRGRVAAAVARAPLGVDLEPLDRAPSPALLASATPDELARLEALAGGAPPADEDELGAADRAWRLRLWTAKEALLKELGLGLGGLSRCRLAAARFAAPDGGGVLRVLALELDGRRRDVLQRDVGGHSLAVSAPGATLLRVLDADAATPSPAPNASRPHRAAHAARREALR